MSGHRSYTLVAVAYVLTMYTTSGQIRSLSNLFRQVAGDMLGPLVTLTLISILAGVLLCCRHSLKRRHILPLLPIVLAYGLALWFLKVPEERFHLLQYGLLTALCAGALPDRFHGPTRHGLVVLLVTLAGIGDELIQWLRPNRVGDVLDVLINSGAAVLAQALIAGLQGSCAPEYAEILSDRRKNGP